MANGGVQVGSGGIGGNPRFWGNPTPPPSPLNQFGNPASFTAAATTQAGDYDRIMKGYQDLGNYFQQNPLKAMGVGTSGVSAFTTPYITSPNVEGSLRSLSDLAATGGLSASDVENIRARDISPIRSIYATGQQEVERSRALQGGYSPSFNATQAQMARDEANKIADVTTSANAGIAEAIQKGKLTAAPAWASAAAADVAGQNQAAELAAQQINAALQADANRALQAGEFNAQMGLEAQLGNRQLMTGALQGETSLYGTTPALTATFGNQVMQANQAAQNQQQINNRIPEYILGRGGYG